MTIENTLPHPQVKLIATGGTIAMRYDEELKASVPALNGEAVLAIAPHVGRYATIDLENFGNKPSAHLDVSDWLALSQRVSRALANKNVSAVVITHGTDTLEDNAFFLDLTLHTVKPVVMVGALRDASAKDGDGPSNLVDAVNVAAHPQALKNASELGVMVVMNGKICAARHVRKNHTVNVDAFNCGEADYLGTVADNTVQFNRIAPSNGVKQLALDAAAITAIQLPRVDIITMYPGADAVLIDAAIAAGAKGLVIQALGAGNLNEAFYDAINRTINHATNHATNHTTNNATHKNIPVVITSRVPNGAVAPAYGFKGGGQTLQQIGTLFAADLPAHKARLVLMLGLHKRMDLPLLAQLFNALSL